MSGFASRSRYRRPLGADESGVTAIEFAFLAPLFFLIVFFAIQLSVGYHKSNTVERAIEKATRLAFLDADVTQAQLQDRVNLHLQEMDSSLSVTIAYSLDTAPAVPIATVTATYKYKVVPMFLPSFHMNNAINVDVPVPSV